MTDDLSAWSRIVRTVAEERRARIAGALSAAAIVMLLITSFTLARFPTINAEPQVVAIPLPGTAVAAPYEVCPKLSKGRWLTAEIAQSRDGKEYVIYCEYEGMKLLTRDDARL